MPSSRRAIRLLQEELRLRMNSRRVDDAVSLVEGKKGTLCNVTPEGAGTPDLFFLLSRCIEDSPTALQTVRSLSETYQKGRWPKFSLGNWAFVLAGRLRLAFYDHDDPEVDKLWEWINRSIEYVVPTSELLGTIHLARSRSLKRRGAFPQALELTELAISSYQEAKLPFMAAIAQVNQSWLLDQLGQSRRATSVRTFASGILKDTQDWANLGNISFAEARAQMRADDNHLLEALGSYKKAAEYYRRAPYPHRNLRRTLLGLAELQMRFAATHQEKRADWIEAADHNIQEARDLMKGDEGDYRNRARLLLVEVNRALLVPRLDRARKLAKSAYAFAEAHQDPVMMPRARLRQAGVEYMGFKYEQEIKPIFAVQRSLDFAKKAIPLAEKTYNYRLLVRAHTLLTHLYLAESPYHNPSLADQHCSEAHAIFTSNEGMGHLADGIVSLRRKLEFIREGKQESPVIVITSRSLERHLEETIQAVERAIVSAAQARFGASDAILSKFLGVGHERIARILDGRKAQNDGFSSEIGPGEFVIFRVTFALVLTDGLENIVQATEHEIIRASFERHHHNDRAVQEALGIGRERYERHAIPLKKQVQASAAAS